MTIETLEAKPEDALPDSPIVEQVVPLKDASKIKGKIIHFTGEKPVAINLEHVSIMRTEGKTIFFDFYNKTLPVDLVDEETASRVMETLMKLWAGDVGE